MAQVEGVYISASTNRRPHAASVSSSSLVAFGCGRLIALWDASGTSDGGVSRTLPGHEAEVTCVKIAANDEIIFSGDQSGTLQARTQQGGKWKVVLDHAAHSQAISALASHGNIVVSGSSDASVRIWKVSLDSPSKYSMELVQTLDTKGRFPLDIQVTPFPETSCLVLAIAGTERDVQIWTGDGSQFVHSASLAGHEDWVSSLAFTISPLSPPHLTLASGSQDGSIRLWTIHRVSPASVELFDAFDDSLGDSPRQRGRNLSSNPHVISIKSTNDANVLHFALAFDALLVGHEASVTSLSWRPASPMSRSPPTLLSTSVDSSLIMWSPSSLSSTPDAPGSTALWINRQRFGDVRGQRLGGFVGGLWAADGREALAWGWNGGWRRWRCENTPDGSPQVWVEAGAITGHQGVVKAIAWDPNGDYLLSTGLDQTARIHGAQRRRQGCGTLLVQDTWREVARPQVHGYDIVGAEFISPLRFVSIADEKVARVFDAPRNFVATLHALDIATKPLSMDNRPAGANVPPLGLSNKATDDDEYHEGDGTDGLSVRGYPFEGELASTTLWPEVEKVFGHGYELISVATSHSGSLAVTACKSSTADHAHLRVHRTQDWQLFGDPLEGHTLTVTRIIFNADDTLILSVSRDRSWRLFRKKTTDSDGYSPLAMDKSHHTRIIWDCAWTRELSEVAFATASRDKTVKIWKPADASLTRWVAVATLKFKEAATAVDFSPLLHDDRRRLVIGLESGEISIYSAKSNAMHEWKLEITLDRPSSHVDSVNRVLWRPTDHHHHHHLGETQQLATCSDDGTIKVMTVRLSFN